MGWAVKVWKMWKVWMVERVEKAVKAENKHSCLLSKEFVLPLPRLWIERMRRFCWMKKKKRSNLCWNGKSWMSWWT